MKAERRHELKTNALARGVEGAPDYWREYGSRLLLVVLIAAIVFLLVRYWNDKKAHDAQMVSQAMDTANSSVHELSMLPLEIGSGGSASDVAENRQRVVQQAEQAINTVLNSTKDPKTLANAYLARGDVNWTLANFPDLPGASTLPAQLQMSNHETFVEQARASYAKVLEPPYSGSETDVFYARMGLAAVAENQAQWDQAKAQYQAIRNAPNMPPSFVEIAATRLGNLTKMQTPVLLVPPPVVAAPEAPATMPGMPTSSPVSSPTTAASSIPATEPVRVLPRTTASQPTTKPASRLTSTQPAVE
jgi:hypothetical protein